jgi:hypothetical protein
MQGWARSENTIGAWLALVVGVPLTHAMATERWAMDTHRALTDPDCTIRKPRLLEWWRKCNLCTGVCLPVMLQRAVHEAVLSGAFRPSPSLVVTWTAEHIALWARACLGIDPTVAGRAAQALQSGKTLLDPHLALMRLACVEGTGELVERIRAQDFSTRIYPCAVCNNIFSEALVRVFFFIFVNTYNPSTPTEGGYTFLQVTSNGCIACCAYVT